MRNYIKTFAIFMAIYVLSAIPARADRDFLLEYQGMMFRQISDTECALIEIKDKSIVEITVPASFYPERTEGLYWTGCYDSPSNLSVVALEPDAFRDCRELRSVELPETLEIIGDNAFRDCRSLESLVVPDAVEYIGNFAFRNCWSLKSLTFGKGLRRTHALILYGCRELTDLTVLAPEPPRIWCESEWTGATAYTLCYSDMCDYVQLHVPASALEAYKGRREWRMFSPEALAE